jgi:hypothetical protein
LDNNTLPVTQGKLKYRFEWDYATSINGQYFLFDIRLQDVTAGQSPLPIVSEADYETTINNAIQYSFTPVEIAPPVAREQDMT